MSVRDNSSHWLLPVGVFEMPPRRAALLRDLEDLLLQTFRRWGYSEVRTPAMEFVEAMARGVGEDELDIAFKFVDRPTGKMMVLRSDVTPQVARMAALALRDAPRPLRVCYVSEVFRYPGDPSNARRELIQAGAELIGLSHPASDAEAVALAAHSLKALGLSGIRITLGQVHYARGVLAECGFPREKEDAVLAAANRKDVSGMESLLAGAHAPPRVREALFLLAGLEGGQDVLDRAGKAAPNAECAKALDNLRRVMDLAVAAGVEEEVLSVDLGDLATFHYHTGVVFTGFVSGSGRAVLDGGRYDDLVGRYGAPAPATGFAIDILELADLAARSRELPPAVRFLLLDRAGGASGALTAARELRERGLDVLCLWHDMPDGELIEFARAHRIRWVLVLGKGGRVERIDPETGEAASLRLSEIC